MSYWKIVQQFRIEFDLLLLEYFLRQANLLSSFFDYFNSVDKNDWADDEAEDAEERNATEDTDKHYEGVYVCSASYKLRSQDVVDAYADDKSCDGDYYCGGVVSC